MGGGNRTEPRLVRNPPPCWTRRREMSWLLCRVGGVGHGRSATGTCEQVSRSGIQSLPLRGRKREVKVGLHVGSLAIEVDNVLAHRQRDRLGRGGHEQEREREGQEQALLDVLARQEVEEVHAGSE